MSDDAEFRGFFRDATGFLPYDWQTHIATRGFPDVLPVPTGLGKTEGAVLAWAFRRLVKQDAEEPLHLVYCLPMRTLVRQTVERLERYFGNLRKKRALEVCVHKLMGGEIDEAWTKRPETPWVLVGTQDQLLSRALNRGYAMSRFYWSVHFGLLNNDCRWIVDEVQLMGPGLFTTAQLDWMRQKRFRPLKPCRTTWMSATLGDDFLATADRARDGLDTVPKDELPIDSDKKNPEMQRRRAAVRVVDWLASSAKIAADVEDKHCEGTLSLVVCNTVETAVAVFCELKKPYKVLLTSRFRGKDREKHEGMLLEFEAKRRASDGSVVPDHPGLICVSTQVVEAGVDISARQLWAELAPWPSVIQRLGRLNRDGRDNEHARAWFWERQESSWRKGKRGKGSSGNERIGPYEAEDIERARELVEALRPLSKKRPFSEATAQLAQKHAKKVSEALRPKAQPMPRALDVHGLFSTERDVHGGFTDVSAFVRGSDPEADLVVFWRDWDGKEPPPGDALDGPPLDVDKEGCPVAFFRLRDMLKQQRVSAWIWNDDRDAWEKSKPDELRPGMVVMLHRASGGYSEELGWTGDRDDVVGEVQPAGPGRALRGDERTDIGYWADLDTHLADAQTQAKRLCKALQLDDGSPEFPRLRTAVVQAAALHDLGKAHPEWQKRLPAGQPERLLAKCPRVLFIEVDAGDAERVRAEISGRLSDATPLSDEPGKRAPLRLRWAVAERVKPETLQEWKKLIPDVRRAGHAAFRPDMRHEAASALAMWQRHRAGDAPYPALAVYLAAAHHGKVRTVLRATTDAGDDVFGVPRAPDTLVLPSGRWPLDFSVAKDGAEGEWGEEGFVLTGHGWTGLVADLLGPWDGGTAEAGVVPEGEPRRLGPFALAYLEALVRIADWRASDEPSKSDRPGGGAA